MKILLLCLVAAFASFTPPVSADMFTPSNSCSKPQKPYEFTDRWQVDQFNNEVEDYKRCISEFVEEQQEEAKHHEDAAQEAIDEWNHFVRYELN